MDAENKNVKKGTDYRPKAAAEVARNMSAIRSTDNRTEVALRKLLFSMGFRYRKYSTGVVGKPDIIFAREKVAVFVDGDYWHGRVLREQGVAALTTYYTTQQQSYWVGKLQRNVARDDYVTEALTDAGWLVLRFWESEVRAELFDIALRIADAVIERKKKEEEP